MNNDNRFFNGFLLGLFVGGAAVFLVGTRTGKNLLKIVSEEGWEGLTNLLEEYELDDLVEVEKEQEDNHNGHLKTTPSTQESPEEEKPKKRFFKRVRR